MSGKESMAVRRLLKEYKKLQDKPVESILARPDPENILVWYFILYDLKHADYKGGVYMGKIVFPSEYPMKPPDLIFLTPNGRFDTNKKICMSFTSYHPETWEVSWTVENMLIGFISFMLTEESTFGAVMFPSSTHRQDCAKKSLYSLLKDKDFLRLFKDDLPKLGVDLDALLADPEKLKKKENEIAKESKLDNMSKLKAIISQQPIVFLALVLLLVYFLVK